MNTINIKTLVAMVLVAFSLISITSCSEDDDSPTTAAFELHFDNHVGNAELDYTTEFTDSSGRKYMFTISRYYISNIRLVKNDNSELSFGDQVLLVKQELQTAFDMGEVEPGMYKGIRFDVGIDSIRNHQDPATYDAGHPLAIQSDGTMHWGWAPGYRFVTIEGMVDTNPTPDDTVDFAMTFHLGTDNLLRSVELIRTPFEVVAGDQVEFKVVTDHEAFFDGVDLRFENFTKTMDNPPLAVKVMDNIANSFE